jgi:hypothetical protein
MYLYLFIHDTGDHFPILPLRTPSLTLICTFPAGALYSFYSISESWLSCLSLFWDIYKSIPFLQLQTYTSISYHHMLVNTVSLLSSLWLVTPTPLAFLFVPLASFPHYLNQVLHLLSFISQKKGISLPSPLFWPEDSNFFPIIFRCLTSKANSSEDGQKTRQWQSSTCWKWERVRCIKELGNREKGKWGTSQRK